MAIKTDNLDGLAKGLVKQYKTKKIRFYIQEFHSLRPHVNVETFERRNLFPKIVD